MKFEGPWTTGQVPTSRKKQKAKRTPIFHERLARFMALTDKIEDELLKRQRNSDYEKPKGLGRKKLYHTNSICFVKF